MCGFAGYLAPPRTGEGFAPEVIERMTDALIHRGPDARGIWSDSAAGIALGHRRLSVLDLSQAGAQPMVSSDGRYVIVYNGEIYNHVDIRAELDAAATKEQPRPIWSGGSDTETLLAAIVHWGLKATLHRAVGMFAFALWDRHTGHLTLVRDRFGEKPLYFGWLNQAIVFGSELKAFHTLPGWKGDVCVQATALYRDLGFVPAPFSIYSGFYKLEPGCLVELAVGQPSPRAAPRPGAGHVIRWWDSAAQARSAAGDMLSDPQEAKGRICQALRDAVAGQLISDVPIGAFLSGGIDSSLICALMQELSPVPVRTFTIRFDSAEFDEAPHARAVAQHLGTDHVELEVQARDAMDLLPRLTHIWDEPFADSSQIPTHLVCRAARSQATVALSGDGGDEMFAGYNRHVFGQRLTKLGTSMPHAARGAVSRAILAMPTSALDRMGTLHRRLPSALGQKAHKFARALASAEDPDGMYLGLLADGSASSEIARSALGGLDVRELDPLRSLLLRDVMLYLPDDILVKVDRASMACGLETRAPFLDHRVAQAAWSLDPELLTGDRRGKKVLRRILADYVPSALTDRPKAGFALPLAAWLRGPLREWTQTILGGTLDPNMPWTRAEIDASWTTHQSGYSDRSAELWRMIMLADWLSERSR